MLDVVAFIIFTGMTYRIVASVKREAAIFAEFKQSKALAYGALLFPLGTRVGAGSSSHRRFDVAGTDRVKAANSAAWEAFGTAITGLAYAAIALVFVVGLASLRGPTDP